MTYWLVAVLFGCCVFIVSFVLLRAWRHVLRGSAVAARAVTCLLNDDVLEVGFFLGRLQSPQRPLQDATLCAPPNSLRNRLFPRETNRKSGEAARGCATLSILLLLLLMACVVSWRFSGQLCEILPTKLQWHIYLPADWQQVLRCHLSFIRVPADVLRRTLEQS